MYKNRYLIGVILAVLLIFSLPGCRLLFPGLFQDTSIDEAEDNTAALEEIHGSGTTATSSEQTAFRNTFMQTFNVETTGLLSNHAEATLLPGPSRRVTPSATIPVDQISRSFAGGSLTDYPEPGLTTSYTVTSAPEVGTNVYRIETTTTYPSSSAIDTYEEDYYVKDVSEGDPNTADGVWDENDPIVNENGNQDQLHRVKHQINFDDGSVRYETIVKVAYQAEGDVGFAPFTELIGLDYPELYYPESDANAVYSSVVVYTQTGITNPDFSFWSGSQEQSIVGVRFYTEHFVDGDDRYKGTTVAFEKAISTLVTESGSFIDQLVDIFIGSEHTTLAESVFRKEVIFPVIGGEIQSSAEASNSVMRTHVVDITSQTDFQLQLLNDESLMLLDWEGATYYVPDGETDEVVQDAPDPDEVDLLTQTVTTDSDGATIPLVVVDSYGPSDLSTLYRSIEVGAATISIEPGNDIPDDEDGPTLDGGSGSLGFEGEQGTVIEDSTGSEFDLTSEGTVEAWVYVNQHQSWAGIVHKGKEPDFSDEAYTLQFWGNKGNVAFAIVQQDPSYKYDYAKSSTRLNTNRWYYLVGTWDADYVKIFINGSRNKRVNNKIGEPAQTDGPIVIGSQLAGEAVSGFYGFKGKINGVRILDWALSEQEIADRYDMYKDYTQHW